MAPRWLAAIVFIALALLPLLGDAYWTDQATRYVLFGLFAMSLSLVWGRGGILCFGQAMFFGIGGYAMAALTMGTLSVTRREKRVATLTSEGMTSLSRGTRRTSSNVSAVWRMRSSIAACSA